MSRMVKCKICGKELLQSEAYKVTTTKENGKKMNKYYCDSIEFETYEQEQSHKKEVKKAVFDSINEILGYTCVNYKSITKELEILLQTYTYEDILNCFDNQKNKIQELMSLNGIEKEFHKLRYIFTVISGNIADDTYELKQQNKNNKQEIIKKIESEDIDLEDLPFSDYTYTEPKGTDFSDFF